MLFKSPIIRFAEISIVNIHCGILYGKWRQIKSVHGYHWNIGMIINVANSRNDVYLLDIKRQRLELQFV